MLVDAGRSADGFARGRRSHGLRRFGRSWGWLGGSLGRGGIVSAVLTKGVVLWRVLSFDGFCVGLWFAHEVTSRGI